MLWRHGDVLIATVDGIPQHASQSPTPVLARGEFTGHTHRLADPEAAELWTHGSTLFLNVLADSATIIHEEHRPITLPRGVYRVWQQREYTPERVRWVAD